MNTALGVTALGETDHLAGMTAGARLAPDGLFARGPRLVVDASHVETVEHDGMQLVPIAEIFAEPDAAFLGFGMPNVYLAVPKTETEGWEKYAATMFWRQQSHVADTKGRVQGGILVQLLDAPEAALDAIRVAMGDQCGQRTITCAFANAKVLHQAGFTSGGKRLDRYVRPMSLARRIWQHGLEFNNAHLETRFIRTTQRSVSDYFAAVVSKESTSLGRLVKKQWAKARKHPSSAPVLEARPLSAAYSPLADTVRSAELRIGRPTRLGAALRVYWGDHPIFEAIPDRNNVDLDAAEFAELNEPLHPYPGKLDAVTKAKKYVLFAPGPVRVVRNRMAATMDSVGRHPGPVLTDMLQAGPPDNRFVYNAIVTSDALRVARLENRSDKDVSKANWVLSKHVLVAGYDPDVRFAGEFWVVDGPEGRTVHLNNNSGTYQPGPERARAAGRFIEQGFGVPVEVHIMSDD